MRNWSSFTKRKNGHCSVQERGQEDKALARIGFVVSGEQPPKTKRRQEREDPSNDLEFVWVPRSSAANDNVHP
jgi:hypothetical protein